MDYMCKEQIDIPSQFTNLYCQHHTTVYMHTEISTIQCLALTQCMYHVLYIDIYRKFLPILPPALTGEKLIMLIFVCIKDCIETMVTFTALAKIYSTKRFCNTAKNSRIQCIMHTYTPAMHNTHVRCTCICYSTLTIYSFHRVW